MENLFFFFLSLDKYQSEISKKKDESTKNIPDYFEYESHIYVDDAMYVDAKTGQSCINSFCETLISVIDEAL